MRRLTPNKVHGCRLPEQPRIGKGNTSLVYLTDDPKILEVYTVEQLKMEWWLRGLNIIEDYGEYGWADYEGFEIERGYYRDMRTFRSYRLPVYRCLVQRLDMPGKEHRKTILKARSEVDKKRYQTFQFKITDRQHRLDWWSMLTYLSEFPAVAEAADFICNYDYDNVYPDFGPGDWAVKDGEIVCIDPYHHVDVAKAFRLRN